MRPRRRRRVARGEAELAKQVARGRAAQVSPNSAFGSSRLRSTKSRPSRRPVPPFRRQNPPHADFSFNPTDFPVQGYRLFGDPYRLFLLRLRGRSDESYGTRFARFPNFCRAAPFLSHHSPRQGRSVPISKTFQGHSNTDTISSKPQRDFIEGRLDFIGTPLGLVLSLEPPRAPLASSEAPSWIRQSPRLHFQTPRLDLTAP